MANVKNVFVSGGFDDLKSTQVRFLQEAARIGPVHVLLWSDEVVRRLQGKAPKFPQAERIYFLESLRYVCGVTLCADNVRPDALPLCEPSNPAIWAFIEDDDTSAKQDYCRSHGLEYRLLRNDDLQGFPDEPGDVTETSSRKRVIVTGCYDWLHSGHVRFFEEVSALGDLYVVVGQDANIEFLKGKGHPLFSEQERRYMVQSVRFVKQGLISSGMGWLDAEPEIELIKPDIYAVNEDGDKPEKLEYCQAHGIEYRILKRLPKDGLPRRISTDLRGF
ncbi:MAG: adenylyltransferase/cytidyltransferase family protein [Thermoguttaceae bacterium]|jgi:cytidyltransferase-like protein